MNSLNGVSIRRVGLGLLLVAFLAAASHDSEREADNLEPAPAGDLEDDAIAAYKKLGAEYYSGEQYHTFLGWDLYPRGEKGVPGFHFRTFPQGKLPAVPVAFGLDLLQSNVKDADLQALAGLENLTSLCLAGTKVTDAGLKHLTGLRRLRWLDLGATQVTDAGLKELVALKNLTDLDLRHTQVTDAGVAELARALPKCRVLR